MSTRGIFGFHLKDKDYLSYNHLDSYPSGLGVDILTDIRVANILELKKLARKVKLVKESAQPTETEEILLKKYANTIVGQTEDGKISYYQLLRELQGKLVDSIKAGYMLDSHKFINDSLSCEYAYILNFDTNEFEVYVGHQTKKSVVVGRYAKEKADHGFYPCSLVKTYPLSNLPTEEDFVKELEK